MKVISFQKALKLEPEKNRRHLFLGNGFSIACKGDIFSYGALFERADFSALGPAVRAAFDKLGTSDFEEVMGALRSASKLVRLYKPGDKRLANRLRKDANALREVLVNAIAQSHPDQPLEISTGRYAACRRFLTNFKSIYTVNYDLLLYWTIMQGELELTLTFDDGFRTPDTGPQDYVTWEVEKTDNQNVHYLHGALHIFDAGHEIKKYTWINTGVRLINQVRAALAADMFPLIVAEGESEQKLAHINHSNLLSRSYRSFAKIANTLFVLGHSLGGKDQHILDMIKKNRRLNTLVVGIFGDPKSKKGKGLAARAKALATGRPKKWPLRVVFFDSQSANVWG